ncbi:hypothetical protein GOP47_0025573 [Adiantum capillus-veneris]|uniref:Protein NRDE2 homolog n=1 Tax=Adiantum capillus-veneris TaxID=13818 RepID=A0A9D4U0L4_ADICA|nr:hypothetical protein GOP47_0025573 [Adiantum capillus-veneris]
MAEQPLFPIASAPPSQLFPVSNKEGSQALGEQGDLTWLANASFKEGLLPAPAPAPAPVPDWYVQQLESEEEINVSIRSTHTLLASSCDDEEDKDFDHGKESLDTREKSEERRKRSREESHRHERKKERKKKKFGGQVDKKLSSKLDLRLRGKSKRWVDLDNKDFQFDARGDRDNLVYDSLYRKDVPLFYRHQIRIWSSKLGRSIHSQFGFIHLEEDDIVMDEKLREGRYWSAKVTSLERRKDFRRLKISLHVSKPKAKTHFLLPPGDFISLEDLDAQEELKANCTLQEESWDDYVIRKTKEFNQHTRERPQDESLWIAFANFQDELIKAATKKAAAQQAVEKKIAILEKALEMHPFSEDLWLLYLDTCRQKDLASALLIKWENAIRHIPRSYRLWRGYLHFRLGEFSLFTVSSVRKVYMHALQTCFAAHYGKDHAEKTESTSRAETEKNLVSFFVDLCRFEWQTGHHELAVGLFQSFIEYNLFSPPLDVGERSKRRLFSEFWDSGVPRIGEDGAVGWALWLQKEEEWIQKSLAKDQAEGTIGEESELGGWTGWYEPAIVNKGKEKDELMSSVDGPSLEDSAGAEMQDTDEDEDADIKDPEHNEQDETVLLERLGLSLQAENEVEVKDSVIWKCWSEKEYDRDSIQWLPVRISNLKASHDEEILPEAGEGEEEQLERAVLFDDIQECLFSLTTADARLDLIFHFAGFCSGPYPQWCCSNSLQWMESMEALENLCGPLLWELNRASLSCEKDFEKFVGGVEWMHESQGRCKFLANALLLLRPFFSNNFWLEEKLLNVENYRYGMSTENLGGFGPRILAKRLLKNDRQAILLLGAYACAEASAGNLDVARKVFDTTLASLSSLPVEIQSYGPIVYECYAEMEICHMSKATEKKLIHQKVLYILSCLGSRIPYTPFRVDFSPTPTDVLRAKRGFKEQIQSFFNEKRQLDVSDQFKAVVVCTSMFELLADGLEAAASTFKESFAMSLPGKRQHSLHFELLHCKYISMLEEHKQHMKPTVLRRAILQTLAQYPSNPHVLGAYIRCSSRTASTNDLRRFFDDALQRNATTVLWLFAISIELGRPGSGPRIHSLFEKAVESTKTHKSVVLWRCYMAYELEVRGDLDAARRVYFRAIHACPWSKLLWLDGFKKMSNVLSAKELSDFQDIMREKELRIRTDVYEILLEEEEK